MFLLVLEVFWLHAKIQHRAHLVWGKFHSVLSGGALKLSALLMSPGHNAVISFHFDLLKHSDRVPKGY